MWFLDQARTRGLVGTLTLDVPGHPSEVSAGAALVEGGRVLVLRVRAEGFELPKGGVEWDELPDEAALRELREEAGVTSPLSAGRTLGHLDYAVATHDKRVYYVAATSPTVELGPLPSRTRERRWVTRDEIATLPLVNEQLRPVLAAALR